MSGINNTPIIRLKCPDLASISPGSRFLYRAKIGGERQIINVKALTSPYPKDFGKGRQSMYVDVFGYGFSGSVQAKKLLTVERF